MIGDILGDILGNFFSGGEPSKKAQAVSRIIVGLLGAALTIAGMVKTFTYDAGLAFRLAGVFMFAMLACFCGFNIAFFRTWKWPGRLFLLSLPLLFAVRIIFGP